MRRIWKCPNCTHFSTRHWNLKLHISRKHKIGQPVEAYVSGKSVLKFPASTPVGTHNSYIIQGKNEGLRKWWRHDLYDTFSNEKNYNYPDDKWFDRISQMYHMHQMGLRPNKPSNMNQVQYIPQGIQPSKGDPDYTIPTTIEIQVSPIPDNVIGFKMWVCEKCLQTNTLLVVPNMEGRSIEDIHKCNPELPDFATSADPVGYYFELYAKVNNIPELLFKRCKDWAKNSGGDLYIVARRVESKGEYEKVQIPENYEEIPWLKKLLVESKIKPDDIELHEFIELVKNETTKLFILKDKYGSDNLVYKIGVSIAPMLSD